MENSVQKKDICDAIIENAIKEWYQSMRENPQNTGPNWEIPRYSKKQINKAGKTISELFANPNNSITSDELAEAMKILNNWRSAHTYPLEIITDNLRKNNPDAIVVQRLKRLDSIIGKIERLPDMSLYRMQDLGGCRVIVGSIDDVYEAVRKYKNSGIPHIFKREDDYIRNPKKSGYRSYHMVYQFQSDSNEIYNRNMLIEVQFRTKLQHIWATAVEMMGIFTKSKLKAGMGNEEILRFFVLVSSLFARMENTPVCPCTSEENETNIQEIKEIDKKLNLVSRISALSVVMNCTDASEQMKEKGYYLLILNYKERLLRVQGFSTQQIEVATKAYNDIEAQNNPDIDIVLVSAKSFDELKAAYPNYFTDISEFVSVMRKIIYSSAL